MEIKNKEQIIQLLNKLAFEGFKVMYNMNDMERIVNTTFENSDIVKIIKKEIINLLPKQQDNIVYEIRDNGLLFILEKVKTEQDYETFKLLDTIHYNINLPYKYTMGKRLSKQEAVETIKQLENQI